MEELRQLLDFLKKGETLAFYHGQADRQCLEHIWNKAGQENPLGRRTWYLDEPDLESKRNRYPDTPWYIDQLLHFLDGAKGASA
jgi:hypothetical protein